MISGQLLQKPLEWTRQRGTKLDLEAFFERISLITESPVSTVEQYYRECLEVFEPVYRRQYRTVPRIVSPYYISLRWKGFQKYAGLDRIALYIITRIEEPSVVYETGVLWGDGSLAFLSALDMNSHGKLHSFDVGWDKATTTYGSPAGTDELGWLVPDDLKGQWDLHVGNSLKQIPKVSESTNSVDLFYHDSLHTFEHMLTEYEIIFPLMTAGGLLMSEDTHQNDAWETFLRDEETIGDIRYNSHMGCEDLFSGGKEVAATRILD